MADDGIRERHGMQCLEGDAISSFVIVYEAEQTIRLNQCSGTRKMTPTEARYLARKLYRLARRIDQRQQGAE